MTDREERQHVIEVLKSWDGYFIGYTSDEVQEALRYAIASLKTDLKYDLLYEETSGQADKPTTKNNLGVDYISKQEVVGLMMHIWGKNHSGDDAMQECIDAIRDMPSVTPQEPILDKIRAEIESKYNNCDICEFVEDYDYEENDISEYRPIGDIADILEIIDKYKGESKET